MIRHNGITIYRDLQVITHRGKSWEFFPCGVRGKRNTSFEAITHLVLANDDCVSKTALFEHIYGGQKDGGPMDGIHVIDVRICQWRPRLQHLELDLLKDKRNSTIYYSIKPSPSVEDAVSKLLARAAGY